MNVAKNLRAALEAGATLEKVDLVSLLDRLFRTKTQHIVVSKRTKDRTYSTTVYDVENNKILRAIHRGGIRSLLEAITRQNKKVKHLKDDKMLMFETA